jgi:hypothetical protein
MTPDAQRWIAVAAVVAAAMYLSLRGWRAWRAARAVHRAPGCGPGCGCE